jgi:hypothetical protein
MPAAAAGWVFGTVFAAFSGAGAGVVLASMAAAGLAYVGVAVGITYALGSVTAALMGRPKGMGGASYRQFTVKAPTAARAIIYGECTVGGVLVFEHTTGQNNQFLDFVVVIAGHQCEDITDVWIDDELVTDAQINGGSSAGGAVTSGTFAPRDGKDLLWIYKYLGTDAQTASSVLTASDGTGYGTTTWTSDHRLRGCTYVHIRCRRNSYWENHGAPSSFRFRVKGAKVYDPRLDSTNGGSGSHRLANATTWAWSNNPALCTADYIAGGTIVNDVTTPVRKRGFGVATPATDIDWDAVISEANICDEDVDIPGPSTQNRYECDILLVPSDDTPDADCLDQLLSTMLGQLVYAKGKYTMYAGAYMTPVYTLTEADLAGPITYVTGKGREERYNYVRGTRYDLEQGAETEFLSRTDSGYVTDDGATLYHDIELPGTSNEYRAQRIAQTILRRSREQQTLIWPGQLSAAKVGIWETVSVTISELGLSGKPFRCIARKRRSGANGEPLVELTLREEFSSTYSDPEIADYDSITVATDPGSTFVWIEDPAGIAIVPDRFFQASTTRGDYWDWVNLVGGTATGVSISLTGGVVAGKAILTGDSTNKYLIPVRSPSLSVATGSKFTITARFRRTDTLSGTGASTALRLGGITAHSAALSSFASMAATGTDSVTITAMNAYTVNEWQELRVELTVTNLPKNQTQHPYGFFFVMMGSAVTAGTVEVDTVVVNAI